MIIVVRKSDNKNSMHVGLYNPWFMIHFHYSRAMTHIMIIDKQLQDMQKLKSTQYANMPTDNRLK